MWVFLGSSGCSLVQKSCHEITLPAAKARFAQVLRNSPRAMPLLSYPATRGCPDYTLTRFENKKNGAAEFQSLRFVRMVRVELTQANAHYPLKVACLPFHHIRISCENQVSLSLWDCKYRHCLVNSKIFSRFI